MSAEITRLPRHASARPAHTDAAQNVTDAPVIDLYQRAVHDWAHVGFRLDDYLRVHHMDEAALARWLRTTPVGIERLRYREVPGVINWPEELASITAWVGCDTGRLAALLRDMRELGGVHA